MRQSASQTVVLSHGAFALNTPSRTPRSDRYGLDLETRPEFHRVHRDPGARHDVRGAVRGQLLPSVERHDAIADVGDLSAAQRKPGAELRAGRSHLGDLSADRVDAAAGGRLFERQAADAVLAAGFDGLHDGRACRVVAEPHLCAADLRRSPRRSRLGDLPSRIIARRAHGVGRPVRTGAIAVPGRRQFRPGARTADGGRDRRDLRAGAPSPGSR